uniref:Uncharacterized protein n=1 Tax=Thermosporothrix sp. COM3 TaxID=2490863 RepID=A0A455SVN2_9CHLR|nr:hypothetical protein KTC_63770 [Thermosporothrix sp. COM3]
MPRFGIHALTMKHIWQQLPMKSTRPPANSPHLKYPWKQLRHQASHNHPFPSFAHLPDTIVVFPYTV